MCRPLCGLWSRCCCMGMGMGSGSGMAYQITACAGVLGRVAGSREGASSRGGELEVRWCCRCWCLNVADLSISMDVRRCHVARRRLAGRGRRNWEQVELSNGVSSDDSSWRMGEKTRPGQRPRRGHVWRCASALGTFITATARKLEDDFFIGVRGYSCL
jgi:hypothetical protein